MIFFLITSPGTFPLNYFFFFSGNTVTKNFVHGRNENSIFFYQKTPSEYFALEIEWNTCYNLHMQSWGHYFMFSHWRQKESFSYHYSTFKVMKRNEKQQMHWSETVNLMGSYQKAAFMRLPLCWDVPPNATA